MFRMNFSRIKLRTLLLLISLFILTGIAGAQDSLWSASYGGTYNESCRASVRLSNGDYLLLGSTFSYGAGDYDIYLVKTDSTGTKLWEKTYGGVEADHGYDIQTTYDGGFIIVGSTSSSGAGKRDIYLIKTSSDGTSLWTKTYGGVENEEGMSVRETNDSGFIVFGTTGSYGAGGTDFYLVRTDSLGDSTWTKTYGGTSGEAGRAVREVSYDSGFVMIGNTGSYGSGYSSFYLVRTDKSGDTLWTANYGGARADLGYTVEVTNDKGYILGGATAPDGKNFYDAYVIKTD